MKRAPLFSWWRGLTPSRWFGRAGAARRRARASASDAPTSKPSAPHRGSILVIVMVSLVFATFALIAFMEKASNDLLVDQRDVLTRRLRRQAYSALEVTLAVLEQFRQVDGGLRSPTEGWGDPLAFAGNPPTGDGDVQIAFEDESGKISLPHANAQVLTNLFKNWALPQADAEALADAFMGWMHKNHVYTTTVAPDYEQRNPPYEAPGRSLRSFQELMVIDKVRDMFYDAEGRPNDLWKRFADSVSLLDFARPNLNGAKPDTLAALGQYDPQQQQNLADYLNGAGIYQTNGPAYFQNTNEAARVAGANGDAGAFATTISALRITVTIMDGKTQFRLAAVIAPPNGATTVQTTATAQRTAASASTAPGNQPQQNRPNAAQNNNPNANRAATGQPGQPGQAPAARNLKYPFTLLEIRENDEIPPAPPPPPTDQSI
jgi:hypothetical protein